MKSKKVLSIVFGILDGACLGAAFLIYQGSFFFEVTHRIAVWLALLFAGFVFGVICAYCTTYLKEAGISNISRVVTMALLGAGGFLGVMAATDIRALWILAVFALLGICNGVLNIVKPNPKGFWSSL